MTSFLRTASTRTLLTTIVAVIAAIAAGTAIAVAASGAGPVPPHKPLASALRGALGGPAVKGVTARISFTNHLIDASNFQGADPLVQGASGRLWLAGDRLRLELQSDNGDAQAVVNGRSFWIYDPTSNTVYEGTLPKQRRESGDHARHATPPSLAAIQRELGMLARHLDLSGAIPGDIAGRPAYTVRVSPRHDGGLLGSVELGWDAIRGVPLRFAVYARGQSSPVLELKATDISYGPVPASDFAISPPSGANVVSLGNLGSRAARSTRGHSKQREVTGVAAVARHLSFKLVAPRSLVGLSRQSVSLLNWQGSPAALVTYGRNLGGIAVIEQAGAATSLSQGSAQGGDHAGLSLPTVSIDGATGQELDTALATMVRFSRGGVSYTVIGSVPPSAAELAARAL